MLNDVTTDLINPPDYVTIAENYPNVDYNYDPEDIKKQQELHPGLKGLRMDHPRKIVFDHAVKVAKLAADHEGWKIIKIDEPNFRIEAVAATKFLRFKDDVVIEIRIGDSGQTRVEIRSKSRVGKSDFGANAKRIKLFLNALFQSIIKV